MKLKVIAKEDILLHVELAKAKLSHATKNTDDPDVDENGPRVIRVYLASLYYSSGQYQTAKQLLATTSCQTQCRKLVVE